MIFVFLLCTALTTCCADDLDYTAYTMINQVQKAWAAPLIARIKQDNHTDILNIVSGTGEITAELAQLYPHAIVWGIERDESMLAHAEKTFFHIPNVHWIHDIVPTYLEKNDRHNTYSGITSFLTLQWLSPINFRKTIELSHKALKENGRCYFLFAGQRENKPGCENKPGFLTQAVATAIEDPRWQKSFRKDDIDGLDDTLFMPTKENVATMCSNAGFCIEELKLKEEDYQFNSVPEFKRWLTVMSPYKKRLDNQHNDFISTVIDAYKKLLPANKDGSIIYRDYLIYAVLKKAAQTNN